MYRVLLTLALCLVTSTAPAERLSADGFVTGLTLAQCMALAVSPDGKHLAAINNTELAVWDAASNELRGRVAFSPKFGASALAFSPDGTKLAVGEDRAIAIYDAATVKRVDEIPLQGEGGVQAIAYSPDGKLLAASHAGEDGDYAMFGDTIFDLATKKRKKQLAKARSSERATSRLVFSHDGKHLALIIGNKQKALELYETATWTKKAKMPYPADGVSVAFFPDDSRLVTGSVDRKIRVHMVVEKAVALAKQFVAHDGNAQNDVGYVSALAFLPDGSALVSASDDTNGLRLWDTKTWNQLEAVKLGFGRLGGLAVAPDGKRLWVASMSSKKILRFAITPQSP